MGFRAWGLEGSMVWACGHSWGLLGCCVGLYRFRAFGPLFLLQCEPFEAPITPSLRKSIAGTGWHTRSTKEMIEEVDDADAITTTTNFSLFKFLLILRLYIYAWATFSNHLWLSVWGCRGECCRDYLGGGQGQVVAKSCHFFDSNEVKCIHHPISQKSGDFVIFFLQTIYIVQKSGLGRS